MLHLRRVAEPRARRAVWLAGDAMFRRVMRPGRVTYRAIAAVQVLAAVALGVTVSAAAALASLVAIIVATLLIEGRAGRTARIVIALVSALSLASCGLLDQNDLQVSAPRTTLRVGETVQLSVKQRQPDGTMRDVTDPASGTRYYTTGESVLIPEGDGRVTCIGTAGRDHESAVIGAVNGKQSGSLPFQLQPAGPGPGLEVTADRAVLQEGERVQLHVFKNSPGGGRKELTATSTGTRYLIFAGQAFPDPSVIGVSDMGLASAVSSIGSYNYRTVFVFVRNEDAVGWIELKVVHA